MQRQQEKFQQAHSQSSNQNDNTTEPKESSSKKDSLGEYVDYEDVD